MKQLSDKSKQYGAIALKVFILCLIFWCLYHKLTTGPAPEPEVFLQQIAGRWRASPGFFLLFLLLALVNWVFEILKWQAAAGVVCPVSFKKAARQSLASFAISLTTPNRVGDYGAKAFLFEKGVRKRILLLNFFSNSMQMAITLLFGGIGLVLVLQKYPLEFSGSRVLLVAGFVLFLAVAAYRFREKELLLKGFTITKFFRYFYKLPATVLIKLGLFSLIRYAAFSSLFYLLLLFFGAEISLREAFPLILSMYLLVSVVPSFFIFDLMIRGGIGIWLFSLAGVAELPVLCTIPVVWLLNFALPAIWGSVYVLSYKRAIA